MNQPDSSTVEKSELSGEQSTEQSKGQNENDEEYQSFIAKCRKIPETSAFHWLELGWQDLKNAPKQSLSYGLILTIISYGITALTYAFGNIGLYLGLLSGFVFLGPILALSIYSISARLERNTTPNLLLTFIDAKQRISITLLYTVAIGILFLIWARAAAMMFIFFPQQDPVIITDLILFLGIGSSIGAVFCAIIFIFSAFSLPMILDRDVDAISAIISSTNAVLNNKIPCLVWASCIGILLFFGVATAYLGFIVILPWLGHATWHAYKETLIVDEIPKKELAV